MRLQRGLEAEDHDEIVEWAKKMDDVLLVAAQEAPKDLAEVNMAMLDELRAMRTELAVSLVGSFHEPFLIVE